MKGLPVQAWERFGIWLAIGLVIYFSYGYRHSRLRETP
jgi:APA family basic amino acid/polyamine antiporter